MSFRFHPDAELEFWDAIQYYEGVDQGLGHDFAAEVYSAVQRAMAYPAAWAQLEGEVRRVLVRRFPYGVLYSEDDDGILVVAVMHLHRDPEYWKDRQ
ncbi:MAG: type II toxin-antitoxin system RelE/ParE family toxin [Desulfovermiculus sp.]